MLYNRGAQSTESARQPLADDPSKSVKGTIKLAEIMKQFPEDGEPMGGEALDGIAAKCRTWLKEYGDEDSGRCKKRLKRLKDLTEKWASRIGESAQGQVFGTWSYVKSSVEGCIQGTIGNGPSMVHWYPKRPGAPSDRLPRM